MTYISNFIYKFYLYSKYKTKNETRNEKIKMKNNENSSKEELIKYSFIPCVF